MSKHADLFRFMSLAAFIGVCLALWLVVAKSVDAGSTPTPMPTATEPLRMGPTPALQNIWLTEEGRKGSATTCLGNMDGTQLDEGLNHEISSSSPDDPATVQQLAFIELEVYFDNELLCVEMEQSEVFTEADAICIIHDGFPIYLPNKPARIGCIVPGKGHEVDELMPLALINVHPQPTIYSQIKPNDDNGLPLELSIVNCYLSDDQGYEIAIEASHCDDAAVTLRYLEGDVAADCVIDALDAQSVAFRWGTEQGDPLYDDFMNVEPSGGDSDTDIDSNDLQFVLGRFGSTCNNPYPSQEPMTP